MEDKIFLDNASTTQIDTEVNNLISKINLEDFYNPSALYHESVLIKNKIENAQKTIANFLKVEPKNIIFTSGATESNNLAIMGLYTNKKNAEYIFSSGEHPSVYNVAKILEQKGNKVNFVKLKSDGTVDCEHLKSLLNENTHFVSIMFISNETGAINNLECISNIIKSYNEKIFFHVDAVQGFGKINLDVNKCKIDALSISAHKFHGPKGVGLFYCKNLNQLKPQILGGGQQLGFRSGTENVSGILGLELATKKAICNIEQNYDKVRLFREIFITKIKESLNMIDYVINQSENNSPYILSISFKGLRGEVLSHMLDEKGVIIGTGSACSSKKQENRILENMGRNPEYVKGSVRISFSSFNTQQQIEKASEIFVQTVLELCKNMGLYR